MLRIVFPFTAIVGQERMKRALILNAINPRIGGVLIRGERGTAKSTAARALAALLPQIEVVVGSRFNLAPGQSISGETLDSSLTTWRQTPFVDLPVSATEDRVVGTLDIEKAIQKGEKHFEPGILAAANRGVLYVDEVNLLDDHVVDLLLDSAAMGVNIVEREGVSYSHPAKFILVGTMNPEEGDLRPQLLDRFAFSVFVQGLHDASSRMEIMERRIDFERDPQAFYEMWGTAEYELSERIAAARRNLGNIGYTRRNLAAIAIMTANKKVDGHRADLVILRGAQAHAAFNGRERITNEDIAVAAGLALPHRMKHTPFHDVSNISSDDLLEELDDITEKIAEQELSAQNEEEGDAGESSQQKKKMG